MGKISHKKSNKKSAPVKELAPLPIIQQLKSNQPHERAWAASSISHLIQDPESKPQFLSRSQQLLESLLTLVIDGDMALLLEGLGALRNLTSDDVIFCHELVRMNALPSLLQPISMASHLKHLLLIS